MNSANYTFIKVCALLGMVAVLGVGCTPQPAPSPKPPSPKNSEIPNAPGGMRGISWVYPQSCPQYGGQPSPDPLKPACYGRVDGYQGGYDNWAKNVAQFYWTGKPCDKTSKKLVAIQNATCKYETNGDSASAKTDISADGVATVDCLAFAAKYKNADCTCLNGITLSANFYCE